MTTRSDSVNDWTQLALLPPVAIEITLRVGVHQQSEHVQAQIEVRDATTGDLLGMQSWPHFDLCTVDDRMREVGREFTAVLDHHTSPFPD